MKRSYLIIILAILVISYIISTQFNNNTEEINKIQLKVNLSFTDVTEESGINYIQNQINLSVDDLQELFSGGAAAGDYNNDGYYDLFVTRLDDSDILYRNNGDGTFSDVTEETGLLMQLKSNGVGWADVDNDNDQDLFITTLDDRYYLFINENNKFSEQAIERLNDDSRHEGFSVSFGDYDKDGYIDIHTTEWDKYKLKFLKTANHGKLFHNLGKEKPGYFEDLTDEANLRMKTRDKITDISFTSSFVDLDNDGWQDLVVVADFGNSRLYWNNKDGTFKDGTESSEVGIEQFGMGNAIGDINNDRYLDWYISSIYCKGEGCIGNATGNKLYINKKNRKFKEYSINYNIENGGWGWGTSFLDIDNDMDLDLFQSNGMQLKIMGEYDFSLENSRLWINENGKFKDISSELLLKDSDNGRGIIIFDYDNDGDLDIFMVRNSKTPKLFRNDVMGNNWIKIKLIGTKSTKDGFGARVSIIPNKGDKPIMQELIGGNTFLGQNPNILHFGLGNNNIIYKINIDWPSGKKQTLKNVEANQLISVEE